MNTYARSHLSDASLLCNLKTHLTGERTSTAELLADIAEVDERKLYVPAGYPSTRAYCVGELHLSEDAAHKRIAAARLARRFPAVLVAVAEGRLHLSGAVMLKPYMCEETAEGLLAAATHKSKSQIERLLAERFPRPDVLEWVTEAPESAQAGSAGPVAPGTLHDQVAPGRLAAASPGNHQLAPGRVIPLSAQSGELQCTLSRSGQDDLRYAQALLGHQVPSGSVGTVIELALKALVTMLERDKFGATARPQHGQRRSSGTGRHVPVAVRRAVWERDQGQCTFVSESGHRCEATKPLEFDQVEPRTAPGLVRVNAKTISLR